MSTEVLKHFTHFFHVILSFFSSALIPMFDKEKSFLDNLLLTFVRSLGLDNQKENLETLRHVLEK